MSRYHGQQDREMAERLSRLQVPEHEPGFFTTLEARLEAESARAGAARRAAAPQGRVVTRTAAASRRRAGLIWIPMASAAAMAVLIWALVGPLGVGVVGPDTVSAAEIARKAAAAVAQARALRGTLVTALPGGYQDANGGSVGADALEETRFEFVCTAEGDFRLSGVGLTQEIVYDHETGVERFLSVGSGMINASEFTGLASGPPDRISPLESTLGRQLGAVVRALKESPQAAVSEDTYEGRPVWVLSADVQPNRLSTVSGDHLVVTVDQATGFPVRVVETKSAEVVREFRLEGLEIDPELTEGGFTLEFPEMPAGTEVYRADFGFEGVDVGRLGDRASAVVGYAPLLPLAVPQGFTQAEVTVAALGQPTGKEGMNPAAAGVVSALWTRGFDRLVVSTRSVGPDASLWTDPLSSGEGFIDEPEKVVLKTGPFAGRTAELLIDARAVPHLWVMSDTLMLTVSGDLTRAELIAVAESLAEAE